MTVYFITYLVLPACFYYLIYKPDKILHLAIFFVPFTGTALFDISLIGINVEGIRVSFFIFIIYFLYKILKIIITKKFTYTRSKYYYLLLILIIIILISQLKPFWISGDIEVYDVYSNLIHEAKLVPLKFRIQYLTQALYCIFGLLIALSIFLEVKSYNDIKNLLYTYIYGNIFLVIWGIFEFTSYYIGIPYPSFIFNQVSMNSDGIIMLYGMPRIMSVTLEPSILSQQLLTVIPFFLIPVYEEKPLIGKKDYLVLFAISFVLVFSTSTTAYLGFFFCIILMHKYFSISKRIIISEIMFGIIMLFILYPYILSFLIEKYTSYSGIVRIESILMAFEYFGKYPLSGIGWGVMPSWDLIFLILSGTGLIGLILFGYLFYSILKELDSSPVVLNETNYLIYKAMFYSFAMLLFTSQVSGFIYHAQYFWVILGFSLALVKLKNQLKYSLKLKKV